MRILQVISDQLPTGTLKQLDLLCQGLRSAEHHVRIVSIHRERTFHREKLLPRFGDQVTPIQRAWQLDPMSVMRLRRELRVVRPDVVHAWGPLANTYACLASARTDMPIITSLREVQTEPSLPGRALRRWTSKPSRYVAVNSEHLRSIQLGRHDGDQKVHLIHNGIHTPTRTDTSRWLHASLNIPAEALLIGCVGDLVPKKRTRDLIWALDLLRVIRPQVRLIVVGEGDHAVRLARFARETSNAGCVHFLGHRTDVQELMTQFFCVWQASEREGCSNAILEAMAQGIPVIASDTPGHRGLIQDDVTGRLVPSGDCAEFARATHLLMADGAKAARLGHHARRFVVENFTVDRMINQFANLYNSVYSPRLGQVA